MILVTFEIDGTDFQISTEDLKLDTFWEAMIMGFASVTYAMKGDTGGYVSPRFGQITLNPDLFDPDAGHWPPPDSCEILVRFTETDEASAIEVFTGQANLSSYDEGSVVYELQSAEYDSVIAATTINAAINTVFATYCGPTYLNLTLDTSMASRNPAVYYALSTERPTLDVLSEIADFFSHLFFIVGTTLYLIDMKSDNGTETIDDGEFFTAKYMRPKAYSMYTAGSRTLAGSRPSGDEKDITPLCHTTAANVDAALADKKLLLERPQIQVSIPLISSMPQPGKKFSWLDTNCKGPVTAAMWVRSATFNFVDEEVVITGDGEIS